MSQHVPKAPSGDDRPALRSTPGSFDLPARALPSGSPPSLTYEPHYGLKEKAFSLSADPRFLYRSPTHAPAFEELLTGIRRREGLIVLTGEIGTGKTTLIRSVLQHLDRRTFTAFIPDPFVSREDLLKMLLVDFGVVSLADLKHGSLSGASRPDLSYPLYEFLDSLVPMQGFAVVIIDEAQNLPLSLLEEIRILSDLEQREKLLQVVLVGQPELKSNLKMPQMRQVRQRVSVRCELAPLGSTDVGKYVRHRLAIASDNNNLVQFTDSAVEAIFQLSGGVPRVINLICDRALQRGYRIKTTIIESTLVLEAVAVLGIDLPNGFSVADIPIAAAPVAAAASVAIASVAVTPVAAAPVSPVPKVTRTQPSAESKTPPVAEKIKATSLPVSSIPRSPQMLSEFAAESDLGGPLINAPSRRAVGVVLIAALLGSGIVAVWFSSFMSNAARFDAASVPPRPVWSAIHAPLPEIEIAKDGPNYGSYAIQVATFFTRGRADRLVTGLRVAGFRAHVVELDLGAELAVMSLVRVEGYRTPEEAAGDLARIRQIPGYGDAVIVSNDSAAVRNSLRKQPPSPAN